MKNFKKRWFRLTNHEFTYQKSKGNGFPHSFTWGPAWQRGSPSSQYRVIATGAGGASDT